MHKDKAVVLVSFGTAEEKIFARTINALAKEISVELPQFELRLAYTSNFIIKKLLKRGVKVLTVDEQISKLRGEGFGEIILLPTHFTAGEEFDNKIKICAADDVKVLTPLFSLQCDTDFDKKILTAVLKCFPVQGEDLILIGHGSPHRHNPVYESLQRLAGEKVLIGGNVTLHPTSMLLSNRQVKNVADTKILIGVIEETDTPNFSDVVERLKNCQAKKILLAPMLFNGGVHLAEDIAGEKNSWRSRLTELGYKVRVSTDGLGSFEKFRALYVEKLSAALKATEQFI